ncbi:hypothetical protein D3OALGB2SA_5415 [Olavius algarvensis associated proteobacterium Delta 3]|nr:hypothetical protein D3OALGB2SA_5415 [Olavius algarvensis associated proteobacterium Delta 3]
MKTSRDTPDDIPHVKLRRCILELLYEMFKEVPFAQVELSHIEESCETEARELNWNIVYLEKCGYVELNKSAECITHAGVAATLTATGIDLVENRPDFEDRFPTKDTL